MTLTTNPDTLICGDCFDKLDEIKGSSIHFCLTDPPYGLDKLTEGWSVEAVHNPKNLQTVKSLPSGMKFDKEQGRKLYEWLKPAADKIYRVLKPGAFLCVFCGPRLYHRAACAVEDAGFLIKDQFLWLYTQNQPKAMSLDHFIRKRTDLSEEQKTDLMGHLSGWKTPQVRSNHEPIIFAQKPPEGTILDNYRKYEVGLVDTQVKVGEDKFPSNVICDELCDDALQKHFLVGKPSKAEKGDFNFHKTVKPLALCEYLIRLLTRQGQIILDPFAGSGTTMLAARKTGRCYYGIELNRAYCEIIERRLAG